MMYLSISSEKKQSKMELSTSSDYPFIRDFIPPINEYLSNNHVYSFSSKIIMDVENEFLGNIVILENKVR